MQQSHITAQSWILMDADSHAYLRGHNTQSRREIASITKMYTLYACLILNQELKINPNTSVVKIYETGMTGTLAHLAPYESIRLIDLYYALMLPSGNDAACIIASYYGNWLSRQINQLGVPKTTRKDVLKEGSNIKLYSKKFIQYVNKVVVKQILNHKLTHFQNPHGLPDKNQVSNVWQLAQACFLFLKNKDFAKIVKCKSYRGYYYQSEIKFEWQTTNQLLYQGYTGIKTGITATAGGCLASITNIPLNKYEDKQLLIIVLGCKGAKARFQDTKKIVDGYKKYVKMMSL